MHATVGEVDAQLRIVAEFGAGAFVAHVGERDGEFAVLQRRAAIRLRKFVGHLAAEAAAADFEEAAGPGR